MTNRIESCFTALRSARRKAFIPYICAGDPALDCTVELVIALAEAGADLVELGLPFSDPLADGIVNQLAAQRALTAGATVKGVLDCVRRIRAKTEVPLVLYTYMNPIFQFGTGEFHRAAAEAGLDGLLILDLPPEEDVEKAEQNIVHIRLVAPTTPPQRIEKIVNGAEGFIYYVSREGVTGARDSVVTSLGERVAGLRRLSGLPVAVGFGISNAEQAGEVAKHADGVVVGSAIVSEIAEHAGKADLVQRVIAKVKPMIAAVKGI